MLTYRACLHWFLSHTGAGHFGWCAERVTQKNYTYFHEIRCKAVGLGGFVEDNWTKKSHSKVYLVSDR